MNKYLQIISSVKYDLSWKYNDEKEKRKSQPNPTVTALEYAERHDPQEKETGEKPISRKIEIRSIDSLPHSPSPQAGESIRDIFYVMYSSYIYTVLADVSAHACSLR